jgi:hypothetical protein
MNFKDKILLISYFVIFISIIASLIFRNISFLLFGIIIIIFLFYVYLFNNEIKIKTRENLDVENLDFLENKLCVKPTKDNPFMNPNILEKSNLTYKSCNIQNNKIKTNMNNYFKEPVFKDVIDIYDRKFSERQFYTIPATSIPNDQESFSKWLYGRGKTCKENNGERCYYNII